MKRLILIWLAIGISAIHAQGPFGFERGMSEADVLTKVGNSAVINSGELLGLPFTTSSQSFPATPANLAGIGYCDPSAENATSDGCPFAESSQGTVRYMLLETAPKPDDRFAEYFLSFYRGLGLLQIVAITPPSPPSASDPLLAIALTRIQQQLSSVASRPDLRISEMMKYESTLGDAVYKLQNWQKEFQAGHEIRTRTWEWECPYNTSYKRDFLKLSGYPLPARMPLPACGSVAATSFPKVFYLSNRVASITLNNAFDAQGQARIWVEYRFDGLSREQLRLLR